MSYDSWKTTEPDDPWAEPDQLDDPFGYYDEYPEEDPFQEAYATDESDTEYRERATCDFLNSMDELLQWMTVRELVKLIGENL